MGGLSEIGRRYQFVSERFMLRKFPAIVDCHGVVFAFLGGCNRRVTPNVTPEAPLLANLTAKCKRDLFLQCAHYATMIFVKHGVTLGCRYDSSDPQSPDVRQSSPGSGWHPDVLAHLPNACGEVSGNASFPPVSFTLAIVTVDVRVDGFLIEL